MNKIILVDNKSGNEISSFSFISSEVVCMHVPPYHTVSLCGSVCSLRWSQPADMCDHVTVKKYWFRRNELEQTNLVDIMSL